jgi:hypothetical protein
MKKSPAFKPMKNQKRAVTILAPRDVNEVTGEANIKPPDAEPEHSDAEDREAEVVLPSRFAVLGEGHSEA